MKIVYDTLHVTVVDTVHRVIADSVTLEALKNSQVFYNDAYCNLIAVASILMALILAGFVGQYFTIKSQASKLLRKANEQALSVSSELLAAAKEEIDERSNELEGRQSVIAVRMANTHTLIALKFCGDGEYWLGLFHYSLYCDICVENGIAMHAVFLEAIKDALTKSSDDSPQGEILLSLRDAKEFCFSSHDEDSYELIVEIFNSQFERYGRDVVESVIQKTRDDLGLSENDESGENENQV